MSKQRSNFPTMDQILYYDRLTLNFTTHALLSFLEDYFLKPRISIAISDYN